jgi:hypothetical protein
LVRCNTSPSIDDAENDTMSAEDLAALRTSSDEEGSADEGDAALRRELQSLHGVGDEVRVPIDAPCPQCLRHTDPMHAHK